MENTVIQRIKSYCSDKSYTESKLAYLIGMEQRTVNNYMSGKRKISFDFIESIVRTFGIDANWLLTGKSEDVIPDELTKSPLVSNGSGTVGSVISGNVTGNGHNIGIIPADTEKELARAQWEAEHFKKENKNLKEQHKIEVSNLKEQLKQAIADKERALTMLDKALSK